jgi:[ribosomal protein S5]-alanine N-acetyltransferase
VQLQQLTAAHAAAVLDFEIRNRASFAATIPDRGDAFFADYPTRHAALLSYQESGTDRFHVLVTDDGAVVARINLTEIKDGAAELGYRVDPACTGRGVATRAVAEVCELAATAYGLTRLHATVTDDNPASATVLLRNGFRPTAATVVDGRPARLFIRS